MPPAITTGTLEDVTEPDRGRLALLGGLALPTGLLVLTVIAYVNSYFEPLGWQGGEYAYAFIWTALGSAAIGGVIKAAAPSPWRSIGSGMLLAGALGVVVVIAAIMVFLWALASWNP